MATYYYGQSGVETNRILTVEDARLMYCGSLSLTGFPDPSISISGNDKHRLCRGYWLKNHNQIGPAKIEGLSSDVTDDFLTPIRYLRRHFRLQNGGAYDPHYYCGGYAPSVSAIKYEFVEKRGATYTTIAGPTTDNASDLYYYPPQTTNSKGLSVPAWIGPGPTSSNDGIRIKVISVSVRSHNNRAATFYVEVAGKKITSNISLAANREYNFGTINVLTDSLGSFNYLERIFNYRVVVVSSP